MKRALITGITGQDGSYLAELLLAKGYEVHGILRPQHENSVNVTCPNLIGISNRVTLHFGSIESQSDILQIVETVKPTECYHLAARSFVSFEFDDELETIRTNLTSTHILLSAIKKYAPNCRFYFAGTSEMFGNPNSYPQNSSTPFYPRSVYGISKLGAYHLTRNYRENYDLFACTGILFNHESPRRGLKFVTRKISNAVARIHLGLQGKLQLGNIDSERDWGFAGDYVEAMHLMLSQTTPNDIVIGTGKLHSVREFCEIAFNHVNLDYSKYVEINKKYLRPKDTVPLVADSAKTIKSINWSPTTKFEDLVKLMVDSDLEGAKLLLLETSGKKAG